MNPNITLGEVKAHCIELYDKYGTDCCERCKFADLGCCDAPSYWKLDDDTHVGNEKVCESRPDWEEMYHRLLEEFAANRDRANYLEVDNARLHVIIKAVEFALGRRLDL